MKVRRLLIVSLAVCAGMALFAVCLAGTLPPGTELPTHWNAAGEVDDTMPALWALLIPVWAALFTTAILAATPFLEPLQNRLEGSAPLLRVVWVGVLVLMVFTQIMIAGPALGLELGISWILVPTGALLLATGNMLPKSRPGFFVGIRTPWTITDTDNWIATHRLGGKLMMAAGLVLIACAFLPVPPPWTVALILGTVLIAAIVPIAYSWWHWRRRRA